MVFGSAGLFHREVLMEDTVSGRGPAVAVELDDAAAAD